MYGGCFHALFSSQEDLFGVCSCWYPNGCGYCLKLVITVWLFGCIEEPADLLWNSSWMGVSMMRNGLSVIHLFVCTQIFANVFMWPRYIWIKVYHGCSSSGCPGQNCLIPAGSRGSLTLPGVEGRIGLEHSYQLDRTNRQLLLHWLSGVVSKILRIFCWCTAFAPFPIDCTIWSGNAILMAGPLTLHPFPCTGWYCLFFPLGLFSTG